MNMKHKENSTTNNIFCGLMKSVFKHLCICSRKVVRAHNVVANIIGRLASI